MNELTKLAARVPHGRGLVLLAMVHEGEATLGLTMLIENLYEFEILVTDHERRVLREAAINAGVEERVLALVDEL
ncbi:MAG: hypothetical protein EA397_17845 [Deltaproteobacteria bacterium]|nr:MAG: hypothetical protein EA397_17845 [Deltaproteobacteria bacterium]